jgi:hypothetical protein
MIPSPPSPPRQLRVTTWRHDRDVVIIVTEPSPLGGPAETTHVQTASVDQAVEFLRAWLTHEGR